VRPHPQSTRTRNGKHLLRPRSNKGKRKKRAILPTVRQCKENLSAVTTQDVQSRLAKVLDPETEASERLDHSAWLEKLQIIERGFVVAMELMELILQGQVVDAQGAHFAAITLQKQCQSKLRKKTLQEQQNQIIARLFKYLQFFMLKQQRSIANILASAMIAVFYRSTIRVMDQVKLLGELLERAKQCDNMADKLALNETVAICLSLIPEVSQTNYKGVDQRTHFNLDWKELSNKVIELLATMAREHPQLQEVSLKCVSCWIGWARMVNTSDSLKWLIQSSFEYFLVDTSAFRRETLFAAREVICKYISLKVQKKDTIALVAILAQVVRLDQDIVLNDLGCRGPCLGIILHELITVGESDVSKLFIQEPGAVQLLFKLTNCKDARVVHWTLACWIALCKSRKVFKKDQKGVQHPVVQRAIVAIVLSAAFPENWEEKDEDFRTDFYMHRRTVTDCVKMLVRRADLKWFVSLCKSDLEKGSNWRSIECGIFGLLAVSDQIKSNTSLSMFLLDLCMRIAKTDKCHRRLATTICMLLSVMSAFVCENLSEAQLEVVVNFLNACLNLSQFDEVWPCSENKQHPSVTALCSMMTTSPESMRGNVLKLIIQAYYQVEYRDVIKSEGLISSADRLQLFKSTTKNILKHVKPQETGFWSNMTKLVWDLFLAAAQKGHSELSHAAQVAMFLYRDTDKHARSDSNTKQKTMMAQKQLGDVLEKNWDFVINLLHTAPKEDPTADTSVNNTPPILQSVCEMIRYGVGRVKKEDVVVKMANDLASSFDVRQESYLLRPFQGLLWNHPQNPKIRHICSIVVLRYLEAINKTSCENMPNPKCTGQIFTIIARFVICLPEDVKIQCLNVEGGTPNFTLLLCGVMARMTHLKDFFKDPMNLSPIIALVSALLKIVVRLTDKESIGINTGNFLFAVIVNLLLSLSFWGVNKPLVDKISHIMALLKSSLKNCRSFRFERVVNGAFTPNLYERYSISNLLNAPLGSAQIRLPDQKQREIIRSLITANGDARIRCLLLKFRNYFQNPS